MYSKESVERAIKLFILLLEKGETDEKDRDLVFAYKEDPIAQEIVSQMIEKEAGIKILHVDGLGGGGGHYNGDAGGAGFADNVVNSALRFRAQAPLVDQLLREIGLEAGDINRLAGGVAGGQAALPPAPKKE